MDSTTRFPVISPSFLSIATTPLSSASLSFTDASICCSLILISGIDESVLFLSLYQIMVYVTIETKNKALIAYLTYLIKSSKMFFSINSIKMGCLCKLVWETVY